MSDQKKHTGKDDEENLLLKELIHKKREETEALRNLLKALEEDGNKINVNPDSYRDKINKK